MSPKAGEAWLPQRPLGNCREKSQAAAMVSSTFANSPHPSRPCERGRSAACSTRRWGESSRYDASG